MANIDIRAVYADMTKCAAVLDDIGADVKVAYTDMDDFLNKKMVFNGKQIYANWQSDARTIFEEKSKLIVQLFTTVQKECAEAANTLREVIKVYEARDSDLAANTLNASKLTKPLDFKHFGNMESAQWGTSVGGVAIKDPGISEKILDGVKAPSVPAATTQTPPAAATVIPSSTIPTPTKVPTDTTTKNTYFGKTVDKYKVVYPTTGSALDKAVDTSIMDVGLTKLTLKGSYGITAPTLAIMNKDGSIQQAAKPSGLDEKALGQLLKKYNLGDYEAGYVGGMGPRPTQKSQIDFYAKDGKYYGVLKGKFTDITDSINKLMSENPKLADDLTVSAVADVNKPDKNYSNAANIWLAKEGKLYSDNAWANRCTEADLFNDGKIYRYHPSVEGTESNSVPSISMKGAAKSYYMNQDNCAAVVESRNALSEKVSALLKSTGADSVEWTCDGKYYDKNGTDVTNAVLKFQSEAKSQGLQYDYVDTNRQANITPDSVKDKTSTVFYGKYSGSYSDGSANATDTKHFTDTSTSALKTLLGTNSKVFNGAKEFGGVVVRGFGNKGSVTVA